MMPQFNNGPISGGENRTMAGDGFNDATVTVEIPPSALVTAVIRQWRHPHAASLNRMLRSFIPGCRGVSPNRSVHRAQAQQTSE
jgi:hypothetical protein